jgi:hypothetical protein
LRPGWKFAIIVGFPDSGICVLSGAFHPEQRPAYRHPSVPVLSNPHHPHLTAIRFYAFVGRRWFEPFKEAS